MAPGGRPCGAAARGGGWAAPPGACTPGGARDCGAGGGWDSPARGLSPRLCEELRAEGIASLRVCFRNPADLAGCVLDVRAGLAYLEHGGAEKVALAGHSLGGAVVIQAAAVSPVAA